MTYKARGRSIIEVILVRQKLQISVVAELYAVCVIVQSADRHVKFLSYTTKKNSNQIFNSILNYDRRYYLLHFWLVSSLFYASVTIFERKGRKKGKSKDAMQRWFQIKYLELTRRNMVEVTKLLCIYRPTLG